MENRDGGCLIYFGTCSIKATLAFSRYSMNVCSIQFHHAGRRALLTPVKSDTQMSRHLLWLEMQGWPWPCGHTCLFRIIFLVSIKVLGRMQSFIGTDGNPLKSGQSCLLCLWRTHVCEPLGLFGCTKDLFHDYNQEMAHCLSQFPKQVFLLV